MEHGKQKQIALALALPTATLNAYWNDKLRPTRKRAQRLEQLTGISAGDWISLPIGDLRAAIEAWEQKQSA